MSRQGVQYGALEKLFAASSVETGSEKKEPDPNVLFFQKMKAGNNESTIQVRHSTDETGWREYEISVTKNGSTSTISLTLQELDALASGLAGVTTLLTRPRW